MKNIIYLALLFLSACSTCNIPLGNYESFSGTESHVTLSVAKNEFVLTHETWQPGQYANRQKVEERGTWSCRGGAMVLNTKLNTKIEPTKAQLTVIGENPLGYPSTTKALVFESSKNNVLSQEILYPVSKE